MKYIKKNIYIKKTSILKNIYIKKTSILKTSSNIYA